MVDKKLTDGSMALQDKQCRVITIEATEKKQDIKLRVVAYVRVSSASDDQLNSFASQTQHYILNGKIANWSVQRMIKILFICHGNICRSPMAEFIMKDLVKKAGLEQGFQIESAATSAEEIGNPVYPPARRKLAEHGIDCSGKTARQLRNSDYEKYDLLIGMEHANLQNMYRICGGDFSNKMHLLMDFTDHPGEVADPWYTGDFDTTWRDVTDGCHALLHHIQKNRTPSH